MLIETELSLDIEIVFGPTVLSAVLVIALVGIIGRKNLKTISENAKTESPKTTGPKNNCNALLGALFKENDFIA
jgi:hypothetical protein